MLSSASVHLTLILHNNDPNHKRVVAGNLHMRKRSHKVHSFSKKKRCRYRKKHSIYKIQYFSQFQESSAGLEMYSPWIRVTTILRQLILH